MSATTKDAWAERYDRAAGALLGESVLAAAQFLRPRGWRQFGRAVACGPVSVLARTTGRQRRVRLPEAYLVAVTDDALHVLQARTEVGCGPVPRAVRPLLTWERRGLEVEAEAEPDGLGTRLTVVPAGGEPVQLIGPPGELTARVVRALGATPVEQEPVADEPAAAAPVEQQQSALTAYQPAPVPRQPGPVAQQPAPIAPQPAPVAQRPAPVARQPEPASAPAASSAA